MLRRTVWRLFSLLDRHERRIDRAMAWTRRTAGFFRLLGYLFR